MSTDQPSPANNESTDRAVTAPTSEEPWTSHRLGWAKDQTWVIPDDFDRWAEDEIAQMFGVNEHTHKSNEEHEAVSPSSILQA